MSSLACINTPAIDAPDEPLGSLGDRVSSDDRKLKGSFFTIYLSRHGESQANVDQIIGGNTGLSAFGTEYSCRLCEFIRTSAPRGCSIFTSTLLRTLQTVTPLCPTAQKNKWSHEHPFLHIKSANLDEIDAGTCDGLTNAQLRTAYPDVLASRARDKLRYRYPNGESYEDLIQRVQPECNRIRMHAVRAAVRHINAERSKSADFVDKNKPTPIWVVSHQATLRCVLAYFLDLPTEHIPTLSIPLHTIFKLSVSHCTGEATLQQFNL